MFYYTADLEPIMWPVSAGADRLDFIPAYDAYLGSQGAPGDDWICEAKFDVYRSQIISNLNSLQGKVERVAGIEPARSAWEADKLPLHHTRAAASLPRKPAFGQSLSVHSCLPAIRLLLRRGKG